MEKAIVPNQIEKELSAVESFKIDTIRGSMADFIHQGQSRDEVLAFASAEGLSTAAASWLYTQVKDKGPSFELVFVGSSKVQAETKSRSDAYVKSQMNLGGGLWLVGFVILVASIAASPTREAYGGLIFVSLILRGIGLWKFIDAKGYDRAWMLACLCFTDFFVMLFIALAPKRN